MFNPQHEVNTRDNRVGTEMQTRGAVTGTTEPLETPLWPSMLQPV